jgi:hypothetical protein
MTNPPFYAAPPGIGQLPFVKQQPKRLVLGSPDIAGIPPSQLFRTIRAYQEGTDRIQTSLKGLGSANTAGYTYLNDTFAAAGAKPSVHSSKSLKGTFSNSKRQTNLARVGCDPAGPARYNLADAELEQLVKEHNTLSAGFRPDISDKPRTRGDIFIHPSVKNSRAPHAYEGPPPWPTLTSHHKGISPQPSASSASNANRHSKNSSGQKPATAV